MFRVRDFIETHGGVLCSVLLYNHPEYGIVCQPRYLRVAHGLRKLGSTRDAIEYLRRSHPEYLRFCPEFDRELVVVPRDSISKHHMPGPTLRSILKEGGDRDVASVVGALTRNSNLSVEELGVTGSFLIGGQGPESDIDLVIYGLDRYSEAVRGMRECLSDGAFSPLDKRDWRAIYDKRGLRENPDYSFQEFCWHEARKLSRAKMGTRTFDLLSARREDEITGDFHDYSYRRLGKARVRCRVRDTELGHDYPARYTLDACRHSGHPIAEIASYTHTYVDQAQKDELVECGGILEQVSGKGSFRRILIGSSREAPEEFMKVLRSPA